MNGVVNRVVLEQVFVSEIFEEIFSSIFLQRLCEGQFQWPISEVKQREFIPPYDEIWQCGEA